MRFLRELGAYGIDCAVMPNPRSFAGTAWSFGRDYATFLPSPRWLRASVSTLEGGTEALPLVG